MILFIYSIRNNRNNLNKKKIYIKIIFVSIKLKPKKKTNRSYQKNRENKEFKLSCMRTIPSICSRFSMFLLPKTSLFYARSSSKL